MRFAEHTRQLSRCHAELASDLVVLATIPSTNDLARRIAEEYSGEDCVVPSIDLIAWEQTRGRGRGDHRWNSPAGRGVYATLLRPVLDDRALAGLPIRVAVALGRALDRHLAGRCGLEWPNDLIVAGRKLGGILIETMSREGCRSAMIGIGVNYGAGDDPAGDHAAFGPGATSLRTELEPAGSLPPLAELSCDLIAAVDRALAAAEDPIDAYRALSVHRPGDHLRCRVGSEIRAGQFLGFDPRGFLRLEVDGREERLTSGEVIEDE